MASDSDSDDVLTTNVSAWKAINVRDGPHVSQEEEQEIEDVIRASLQSALVEEPEPQEMEDDVRVDIPEVYELDREEYVDHTQLAECVSQVLSEVANNGHSRFRVLFDDGHFEQISSSRLLHLEGGTEALKAFKVAATASDDDQDFVSIEEAPNMTSTRGGSRRARDAGFVDPFEAVDDLDDEDEEQSTRTRSLRPSRGLRQKKRRRDDSDDDLDDEPAPRRSRRVKSMSAEEPRKTRLRLSLRNNAAPEDDEDDDEEVQDDDDDDDMDMLTSDVMPRRSGNQPRGSRNGHHGTRQSGRATRHQGDMEEVGINEIYRSESEPRPVAPPKAVGAKEIFIDLPRTNAFRTRHTQQCDTCGNGINYAPLIYCQGCTMAYHKSCLGTRTAREHLVTKIGPGDFVLQCRRCVSYPRRKEPTAPDHALCQDCKEAGSSSRPFRSRRSAMQEQKEREDNNGDDPVFQVPSDRINNSTNVLFRCTTCFRGFHFEHLPPRSDVMELDSDGLAAQRFAEYGQDWRCKECVTTPGKVSGIIAWKPVDEDNYDSMKSIEEIDEDNKAYLLRWENKSYFRATWMPGPWVWGATAGAMRKAFARRDEARLPKMRFEDAIPEEYLRTDIVLDVKYTSIVDVHGEEIDKARIREVREALIKFKGLGYEDAVWEKPPIPEDEDRWTDFVTAYNDWVLGKYVHLPKSVPMKARLEKARGLDFATKLEKKKQPDNVVGGDLMKYQLEGLNWLYYKWYTQKNAILADEMGLGKTIQIISFLATLVQDWNCLPFLVVVPNSTCANWRREIKQWAPSLRVVAYFGSKEARDLAYRYELYPRGSKELRCHVVVTSYDAAQDDSCRRFFRSVPWQALIVDEGQRLKNDKNLLYAALTALKCPLRILLTGTPLQNNARELFNLLQFLDEDFKASELETEYENLNAENIPKLHDMIRPFFLRRTKAQVLTFLPPMAQIIVPVSMSSVQKKLYRSILAKNPELLRAIFAGKRDLKGGERASLSNILMQLRKCLCHPFVYSQGIEERNVTQAISHRNLVEASGKLQLLEILLPKLKERGHRVLIFSQFLDMLSMVEDFLDGLALRYQRLDGSMGSLQKQRRIDEFNAPDSELFAFLLSTRAGGVGINLATADTVIILDPDFNPHQDIQALSRAHRIGQKKKVLCFQLVTRSSAEEKVVQIGRKKMALDHVLIEQMDADDTGDLDLESVLRHGASEIFSDDGGKDVMYDGASIDKLLDRSHIEDTKAGEDKSAESQFSFARVWANNELEDSLPTTEAEETAPDTTVWDKILKERERAAAAEAAAAQQALGRGRRTKVNVDYGPDQEAAEAVDVVEGTSPPKSIKKVKNEEDSDTDFQTESDDESGAENTGEALGLNELDEISRVKDKPKSGKQTLICKLPIQNQQHLLQILKTKTKTKTKSKQASASNVKKPATKSSRVQNKPTTMVKHSAASASKVKKPAAVSRKTLATTSTASKKSAVTKAASAPSVKKAGFNLKDYIGKNKIKLILAALAASKEPASASAMKRFGQVLSGQKVSSSMTDGQPYPLIKGVNLNDFIARRQAIDLAAAKGPSENTAPASAPPVKKFGVNLKDFVARRAAIDAGQPPPSQSTPAPMVDAMEVVDLTQD